MPVLARPLREANMPVVDKHVVVGRSDVDLAAPHDLAIDRKAGGQWALAREDLR